MKEYKVPVAWVMCGFVTVKAESAVEAYEKAVEIEEHGEGFSLPTDSDYVDGSFEILDDIDQIEFLAGERKY